jgi:hypothetical protein
MYSDRELIRLSTHKAALRQRIARHRRACVTAAAGVARPLAWVDRLLVFWRRFAPYAPLLAVVPLGLLRKRAPAGPSRLLGTLLRWGPVVLGAVRAFRRARAAARHD